MRPMILYSHYNAGIVLQLGYQATKFKCAQRAAYIIKALQQARQKVSRRRKIHARVLQAKGTYLRDALKAISSYPCRRGRTDDDTCRCMYHIQETRASTDIPYIGFHRYTVTNSAQVGYSGMAVILHTGQKSLSRINAMTQQTCLFKSCTTGLNIEILCMEPVLYLE